VGLFVLESRAAGFVVRGDEFSIAAAYAFDNVLNAVGDVGSMSDFNAVADFPKVIGAVVGLICRESRGLFGGDDCGLRDIVIVDVQVCTGASII
jgi:hypothetical protein